MTHALGQEGYEVTAVEDGRKAVEAAKSQHFDFIITDLIMPELDGWKVLEMATQTQPPPRVIIITAKGNEDTGRIAKEKGAWAYVEKPYIIDRIKEILNSSAFTLSKLWLSAGRVDHLLKILLSISTENLNPYGIGWKKHLAFA